MDEVEERFGRKPELRRVQMESLRWLVELATRAGALRLIINGSFVTRIRRPNDVDCVLLAGADFPRDVVAEKELRIGLPFLDIDIVDQDAFDRLVGSFFATDRRLAPKGMIEVVL